MLPPFCGKAHKDRKALRRALQTRNSMRADSLQPPAPTEDELAEILDVALKVPDHGRLEPWRLHILYRPEQEAFARRLAPLAQARAPEDTAQQIAHQTARATRAPLLIVVVCTPRLGKIPMVEQQLSTGALCFSLLLSVQAHGWGAQWLTGWPAAHPEVLGAFGHSAPDHIAGFLHIGRGGTPIARPRPERQKIAQRWKFQPPTEPPDAFSTPHSAAR